MDSQTQTSAELPTPVGAMLSNRHLGGALAQGCRQYSVRVASKGKPRRSVLFLPGSNARALEKAKKLPADVIAIDLEDAVAPEMKPAARTAAANAVLAGFGSRESVVRLNGVDTEWFEKDLEEICRAKPSAIILPKVQGGETISDVCKAMDKMGVPEHIGIWAMIETPFGVLRAEDIAKAGQSRMETMVMGTSDLTKDLRSKHVPSRVPLLYSLSHCLMCSRAYGVMALDGVCLDLHDSDELELQCRDATAMGFDGKTLIHPKQIEPANRIFAPTEAQVDLSKEIISAFSKALEKGSNVVVVQGKLIENLHVENARRIISMDEAIKAKMADA